MSLHAVSPGTPIGYQFDYAEVTAAQTAGAEQDFIAGASVNYDGSTKVKIEFFCPEVDSGGSSSGALFYLYDGATNIGRLADSRSGSAAGSGTTGPAKGERLLTPTAGFHTYKIRSLKVGSAAVNIGAGSGATSADYDPAFLRITKA